MDSIQDKDAFITHRHDCTP